MPRITTLARTGEVPASVEQIRDLVASTDGYTQINPFRTSDPKLVVTPFGPASGAGAGFRFAGKDGKGTQTVDTVSVDGVSYAVDMGALGRSTQSIRARRIDDARSEVTWTMQMDAGANPIRRVFGLLAGRFLAPVLETGVHNLATHTWTR